MSRVLALLAVVSVIACGESRSHRRATPPVDSSPAAVGFRLTDSIPYRDDLSAHMLAVLRKSMSLIDTVDLEFGVHEFGTDSVLYRVVSGHRVEEGDAWADLGSVTLYASATRMPLNARLAGFGPFSSPTVIDGSIYYWSVESPQAPDTANRLWARRYNVRAGAADSLLLGSWVLPASDDPSLLPAPTRAGVEILFSLDSTHVWRWMIENR